MGIRSRSLSTLALYSQSAQLVPNVRLPVCDVRWLLPAFGDSKSDLIADDRDNWLLVGRLHFSRGTIKSGLLLPYSACDHDG